MHTSSSLSGRDKIAVAVLCAAQFMLIVDVVVVNVALPTVREALNIADADLSLTAVAYTVTFGSLLIASGRAGDAYGRRRLFCVGVGLFTVASMLSGVAVEPWHFFGARALQGVGAAMVSANALALILSRFQDTAARNKAMGVWGAVGSAGAIAGQVLGGVIAETLGWRWIFLINVPLGILATMAAVAYLHESKGATSPMDVRGSLLLVSGLAPLVLALVWVPSDGLSGSVVLAAVAALVMLATFVSQQRASTSPLVTRRLLGTRGVRLGNVIIALSAATVAASLFFTTLYLQVVLGHSALFVGLAFGPITLMIMALAPVTAKVVTRHGARLPLLVGLVLTAGGTLLLSRISVDGSYWTHVLPGLLLIAAGSALSYVPTFIAATAEVPSEEQGAASGLINTSQEIGPAVGLAALAAVAATWSEGGAGVHGLVGGYSAGLVATAAIAAVAVLAAFWVPADLGRATPDARESDAAPGDASLEPSHSA